jgi:hypothetical protein
VPELERLALALREQLVPQGRLAVLALVQEPRQQEH